MGRRKASFHQRMKQIQSKIFLALHVQRNRHAENLECHQQAICLYDGEFDEDARTGPAQHDLRPRKSIPTIANQLRRISSVLSPPDTVVHRPNYASRPTILTGDNAQDSYTPSPPFGPVENTTRSSSASLFHFSATTSAPASDVFSAPTSLFSSGDSRFSIKSLRPTTSSGVLPLSLPTISETPTTYLGMVSPQTMSPAEVSITTVERAAAAKVFLETFYNKIYPARELNSRSVRRRALEDRMFDSPLSICERQGARLRFFKAETEHLRLTRVLKSKGKQHSDKLSAANYEVTRILGKGSFGIVKLVRQKVDKRGPAFLDDTDEANIGTIVDDPSSFRRASRLDLDTLKPQMFAMKVIRKSDMLRNSQEGHLRAERDFLVASANSRWVVPLVASFQDPNHLYLVMEYMVGGDFLGLLFREDVLPEWAAKWYVAQMILCVEEAHKMKWIHRDVKPDNFLISASGHLKISDFGLAFDGHWSHHQLYYNATRDALCQSLGVQVHGDHEDVEKDLEEANSRSLANAVLQQPPSSVSGNASACRPEGHLVIDKLNGAWKRKLAKSVVGTSQYMAPEVIRGEQYDGRCDWWSVGTILYECLYGRTPFYMDSREETKKRILEHDRHLNFPDYPRFHRPQSGKNRPLEPVTDLAIDLISSLLTKKEQRLSCRRYRDNDPPRYKRPGCRSSRLPGPTPYFIHANDADDIKAHPFFSEIVWDEMHVSRPPWTPTIKRDQSITRWFEDESVILGPSSEQIHTSDLSIATTNPGHIRADLPANGFLAVDRIVPPLSKGMLDDGVIAGESGITLPIVNEKKAVKDKKRPRDKILRDPVTGPTALLERKATAFLGYTYRRPDTFPVAAGEERIGRVWARQSIHDIIAHPC